MDGGAWWAAVHGVAKSQTRLSDFTFAFHFCFSLSCIGEGNGNPLQCPCLENPMDGGAWWAAVHGVAKSQKRLSDFTFAFHFHALEKKMATHSSTLAWKIPWMEEPAAAAKSLQLCPTLCDPRDGSPPSSATPGILQARKLEWVAIFFSNARK